MNDCFIISNNVSDITQVEFLCLCSSLKILTLEGNPICTAPNALSSQEVGTKSIQQSASVYAALCKALVKKVSIFGFTVTTLNIIGPCCTP